MSDQDLIDLREVAPAEVGEIDLYQRREKIYTRKIFIDKTGLYEGESTEPTQSPFQIL